MVNGSRRQAWRVLYASLLAATCAAYFMFHRNGGDDYVYRTYSCVLTPGPPLIASGEFDSGCGGVVLKLTGKVVVEMGNVIQETRWACAIGVTMCVVHEVSQHRRIFSPSPIPDRLVFASEEDLKHDIYDLDYMKYANSSSSTLQIIGDKKLYTVGDEIQVSIRLFDGLRRPKSRGGDLVRVWMKESTLHACAAGHVIDHNDGRYTATLKALWAGTPAIVVGIAGPRESIKILFKMLEDHKTLKTISAVFEIDKKHKLETPCVPFPEVPGYYHVCNLTSENYGLPWYCGKPLSKVITCFDWKYNIIYDNTGNLPLTDEELRILKPTNMHTQLPHKPRIIVMEKGGNGSVRGSSRNTDVLIPCNELPADSTWRQVTPVGHYYKWTWHPVHCKQTVNTDLNYHLCLRHRRILIYGDSTTRQWFVYLRRRLQLSMATQMFEDGQPWHKPCLAVNQAYNYSVFWGPHELPFYGFPDRGFNRPTYVYLDELPDDTSDIVVIHYYLHFVSFHPDVFARHMRRLYQSVASLLARSPNVTIAIKGPHAFSFMSDRLNDYWGPVYDNIMRRIFKPVINRVLYLDYWDMSVASESLNIHPNNTIVATMVNYMMSMACRGGTNFT